MKPKDRHHEIIRIARASGVVSVETLTTMLGVTASTIRRDLAELTASGDLTRTFGGVLARSTHRESPLAERTGDAIAQKRALGAWCATQVSPGDSVLLDAGTTTAQVGWALRDLRGLRVVAAGLTPLESLTGAADIELLALGGHLREISQGFVGPLAEAGLDMLTFDIAFLGADAVTAAEGLCEASLEQVRLKGLMARRADRVFVVAHASKVGQRPFHTWMPLQPGWTVVTNASAPAAEIERIRDGGVRVVLVDVHGNIRE